jgi:D-glycero-alpha-D-manno-heptose-7-phosphate kinase
MILPDNATIVAHAPCRVDLAGGTLDIWPLYVFHPGAVTINFGVNILTRCRITSMPGARIHLRSVDTACEEEFSSLEALCSARKYKHPLAAYLLKFFAPEGGLEIETNSESPAGAGISGSSALMIAMTAALARFTGRKLDREQIRVIAQNVEAQLIRVPTGCQDYYPALYGGVSAIHLDVDGIRREPIPIAPEELDRRFVLVYTGAPRQSGINNWRVFKKHIDGDSHVFRNFEDIGEIARGVHKALCQADWGQLGRLIREEWKLRKTNAPGISTPAIERLIKIATRNGAAAAKVCGAGGGGCVIFITEPDSQERVTQTLRSYGAHVLSASVTREGLTISGKTARNQPLAIGS